MSAEPPRRPLLDDAALFRQATSLEALQAAWAKVLGNGGAAVGDNVTLERFLGNAPQRLARLTAVLRDGSYTPGPLRRLNRDRQDGLVLQALTGLNGVIRKLPQVTGLAELMGHEGQATALYWPALGRTLQHGFTLKTRQRKEVTDPVNILLNVTASLLARGVGVALERAALHPGFGALHATDDYRDAAVYDLMEEFRAPLAESVVVQAINSRAVGHDAFEPQVGGGLRLKSAGYAAMVRAYERAVAREVASRRDSRRRTWRGIMLDQAQGLAAHVEGRESYRPYVIDY